MDYEGNAQTAERANIRFPAGMRERIKNEARRNQRTMNAEIIFQLNRAYNAIETKKADAA